jgi:acetyltransferase-like isoleucine patch superfamily enzyme
MNYEIGYNLKRGNLCTIESDVSIGNNVELGHYVTLKSGTTFGDNVKFADYCRTTGLSYVGNNVSARNGAVISKGVIVEDCAFIGPGVMTNHTKNVAHMRGAKEPDLVTHIGYGAIIGSMVSMVAGVRIGDNVVLGASSLVTKDVLEPAIYVGNPLRKLKDLAEWMLIKKPDNYEDHEFTYDELKKFMPLYFDT